MSEVDKYLEKARARASVVRLRTWTLTIAILLCLLFYLVVSVTTKQKINWIDFALLSIVQIVIYSIYFPDGDLYGQRDSRYVNNKKAYNLKASNINKNKQITQLREYCKVEFEERKKTYILNQCGFLGITLEELELLKQKTESEIDALTSLSVKYLEKGEEKEKLIIFSKRKKRILKRLLFKPIPIEENFPETIMSAIESRGNKAIRDGSVTYKAISYTKKVIKAVVIGGIFAYIGYTVKDGFGIAQIVAVSMYITTMFTTAVMAYSAGENCSKIYKATFYLELANFIDGFSEWLDRTSPHIETQQITIHMAEPIEKPIQQAEPIIHAEPIEEEKLTEVEEIEEIER